jgi:hypothetical protein
MRLIDIKNIAKEAEKSGFDLVVELAQNTLIGRFHRWDMSEDDNDPSGFYLTTGTYPVFRVGIKWPEIILARKQ